MSAEPSSSSPSLSSSPSPSTTEVAAVTSATTPPSSLPPPPPPVPSTLLSLHHSLLNSHHNPLSGLSHLSSLYFSSHFLPSSLPSRYRIRPLHPHDIPSVAHLLAHSFGVVNELGTVLTSGWQVIYKSISRHFHQLRLLINDHLGFVVVDDQWEQYHLNENNNNLSHSPHCLCDVLVRNLMDQIINKSDVNLRDNDINSAIPKDIVDKVLSPPSASPSFSPYRYYSPPTSSLSSSSLFCSPSNIVTILLSHDVVSPWIPWMFHDDPTLTDDLHAAVPALFGALSRAEIEIPNYSEVKRVENNPIVPYPHNVLNFDGRPRFTMAKVLYLATQEYYHKLSMAKHVSCHYYNYFKNSPYLNEYFYITTEATAIPTELIFVNTLGGKVKRKLVPSELVYRCADGVERNVFKDVKFTYKNIEINVKEDRERGEKSPFNYSFREGTKYNDNHMEEEKEFDTPIIYFSTFPASLASKYPSNDISTLRDSTIISAMALGGNPNQITDILAALPTVSSSSSPSPSLPSPSELKWEFLSSQIGNSAYYLHFYSFFSSEFERFRKETSPLSSPSSPLFPQNNSVSYPYSQGGFEFVSFLLSQYFPFLLPSIPFLSDSLILLGFSLHSFSLPSFIHSLSSAFSSYYPCDSHQLSFSFIDKLYYYHNDIPYISEKIAKNGSNNGNAMSPTWEGTIHPNEFTHLVLPSTLHSPSSLSPSPSSLLSSSLPLYIHENISHLITSFNTLPFTSWVKVLHYSIDNSVWGEIQKDIQREILFNTKTLSSSSSSLSSHDQYMRCGVKVLCTSSYYSPIIHSLTSSLFIPATFIDPITAHREMIHVAITLLSFYPHSSSSSPDLLLQSLISLLSLSDILPSLMSYNPNILRKKEAELSVAEVSVGNTNRIHMIKLLRYHLKMVICHYILDGMRGRSTVSEMNDEEMKKLITFDTYFGEEKTRENALNMGLSMYQKEKIDAYEGNNKRKLPMWKELKSLSLGTKDASVIMLCSLLVKEAMERRIHLKWVKYIVWMVMESKKRKE